MDKTIYTIVNGAIIGLVVITFSLVGIQCFVSNGLSEEGKRIYTFDRSIESLQKENTRLREKIAQQESTLTIREKALQMGLSDNHSTLSLTDAVVAARITY